jgi:polysaccharide biosynthesis protein PslJ
MIAWRTLIQDLLEGSPLGRLYFNRRRWVFFSVALLVLLIVTVSSGWLIAELGPLAVGVIVLGLVYTVWVLFDLEMAYIGVVGVIALLPFASLPFSIGFTPTFLDLALLALFGAWGLIFLLGRDQQLITTPVGGPILAFTLLAVAAFVAGLANGALTTYLARHFAEVLLSISIFFVVVNTVRDAERLERLVRWVILGASAAALLAIVLYVMPEEMTIRALSALGRFGYPTGQGVIWHIRDDPELMKRATGTSVHPNVLGSLLNFGIVMLVPQLLSKRPMLPHWVGWSLAGLLGMGLVLTVSRSAMLGVGLAVVVISLIRYRKLLPVFAVVAVFFLVSPWSQSLVGHFSEGFLLKDLSTQMRMGEYKDTLTLIQRYPFLGVGFSGAPDIDIYVAVASLYLIVAAQMGLVGLTAFLVVLGTVLWRFWRRRRLVLRTSPALEALWYGLHAAVISGVISGIFDHFFFSLDFHHSVTLFWLVVGLATAATELVDAAAGEGGVCPSVEGQETCAR